jgi:hypothetical protein
MVMATSPRDLPCLELPQSFRYLVQGIRSVDVRRDLTGFDELLEGVVLRGDDDERAPVTAMTAAGTRAHFCGCSVRREERAASAAQPRLKPSRKAPVVTLSVAPGKTTRTSTRALTIPMRREPATTLVAEGRRRGDVAPWWAWTVSVSVLMAVSLSQVACLLRAWPHAAPVTPVR